MTRKHLGSQTFQLDRNLGKQWQAVSARRQGDDRSPVGGLGVALVDHVQFEVDKLVAPVLTFGDDLARQKLDGR